MVFTLIIFSILATTHLASSYPSSNFGPQVAFLLPASPFQTAHETSNGIAGQEQGQLTNTGTLEEVQLVPDPSGEFFKIKNEGDVNGFQLQGADLSIPPLYPKSIA